MKKTFIFSAIAIVSLCFASCQRLGDLSANIPDLDATNTIEITDGQTLSLPVNFLEAGDHVINGTATSDNANYPVVFESNTGNNYQGMLSITAPKYILKSEPVTVTLKLSDETDSRTYSTFINVKPVVSKLLNDQSAPANSYMTTPGSLLSFPTNLGNTTTAVSFDKLDLLWQDEHSLVEEILEPADGKALVKFSEGKQGNAVFTAKKGDEIVWSWHVWVSTEVPSTVKWTDAKGKSYEFMDRNLGARCANDYASQDINGVMYQWGRKDAFPAPASAEDLRKVYNIENSVVEMTIEGVTEANMVALSIQKPFTYFGAGSNSAGQWSWLSNQAATQSFAEVGDYWGGATGKKGQYDPCPAGYKVADMNAFAVWFDAEDKTVTKIYKEGSTANADVLGAEIAFDGKKLFFPFQGDLAANTGDMEYGKGSTWPYLAVWSANLKPAFETSGNKNDFQGMGLRLSPTFGKVTAITGYSMSYTFPVRCVKE